MSLRDPKKTKLRKILNKLNIKDILSLASNEWEIEFNQKKKLPKKSIVIERILKQLQQQNEPDHLITEENIAFADLKVLTINKKLKWSCLKLCHNNNLKNSQDTNQIGLDQINRRFYREFSLIFPESKERILIHSIIDENSQIFVRVSLNLNSKTDTDYNRKINIDNNIVFYYVCALPSYIFVPSATLKKKLIKQDTLFNLLELVFNCTKIKKIDLESNDLESLHQLLLFKSSQGSYKKYQLQAIKNSKLKKKILQSDKSEELKEKTGFTTEQLPIVKENLGVLKDRMENVVKQFGQFKQPVIQNLQFDIKGRLQQENNLIDSENIDEDEELVENENENENENIDLPFQVKFCGPDVLNGIRDLGSKGILSTPFPKSLKNIHSNSSNIYEIILK
ncbi:centromere protein n [Anaeramoeba flamelloides]|uniref:Centromere protein n n=1 Tax=Anaeramoeba flamelloides TaxID=1746091 RepID=A0AAV7Z484_9EUKA|nr:centromere protein n [Anaeramoeba flamelloides]